MKTTYKTIASSSESYFKEKGSKFYTFAFPVETEEEVKERLQEVKRQYKDARHHCYAFKLGAEGKNYRYSDDGEPSNTAGKPIYGQLNSFEVTNVLVVVVRYFGGIKLGVGGLIQAYKEGAKTALEQAEIITKEITQKVTLNFSYEQMNNVMKLIKMLDLKILNQTFEQECSITISYPIAKEERLNEALKNNPAISRATK